MVFKVYGLGVPTKFEFLFQDFEVTDPPIFKGSNCCDVFIFP